MCVCLCVCVCVHAQLPVNEEESSIWKAIWDQAVSLEEACEQLSGLFEKGVVLTHQSNDLLAVEDPANRPGKKKEPGKSQSLSTFIYWLSQGADVSEFLLSYDRLVPGQSSASLYDHYVHGDYQQEL